MSWDLILSLVAVLFAYSLIPTIIQVVKNKQCTFSLQTILITLFGMIITEIFYLNEKMYWTFSTGGITTTCWFILLFLKTNDFKKIKNHKRISK